MKIAVIGNSAAAISGVEAFRKYDQKSAIAVISHEKYPSYSRVLLPYLLLKRTDLNQIPYRSARFYDQLNIKTFLGRSVVAMDIPKKSLCMDSGQEIPFDKLLISSGSSPVKPPVPGLDDEDIGHLWTIEDMVRIDRLFREKKHLLLVGGGVISLMLAWVALQRDIRVTIIELLPHIMPQILDRKAARLLEAEIRRTGTRVLTGTVIERIEKTPKGHYLVCPANQSSFHVDMVIVAAGVQPNVRFVDTNLIDTDRGILVNDKMETCIPDIYAAGDVAQGPSAFGDPHTTAALWTTAVEHGKIAGANMAGTEAHYQGSLSDQVSEFFHVTVASVGILRESAHVVAKVYFDSRRKLYMKLLWDGDVPVGGIMLGHPEDVSCFGVLRSHILRKKALPNVEILLTSPMRPPGPSIWTESRQNLTKKRIKGKTDENHFN